MKDLCQRYLAIKEEMESNPDVAARDAFSYLIELQPLLDLAVKVNQEQDRAVKKKVEPVPKPKPKPEVKKVEVKKKKKAANKKIRRK